MGHDYITLAQQEWAQVVVWVQLPLGSGNNKEWT
jgi:hypothetical protein